jgi:tRNA A37 methylthiotransferase MiaB
MNNADHTGTADCGRVFLIDESKRCEPSAFLFTRAVRFFLVNGYHITRNIEDSEIVLINTCCVTEDKIATSRAALDYALHWGKGKKVVLFGCLAELSKNTIEHDGVIPIGPTNIDELDAHFEHHTSVGDISVNRLSPALYEPGQGLGYNDYFLMIAQGCSNHCSYCNIKRVKGEVRSEAAATILADLRQGLSQGVRNFALLADDCASYGCDLGTDLVQLMELLLGTGQDFGLKLGYLYPQFLLTHFRDLQKIFETGRISYVNIPVQSGSQRILDLMNRCYPIDAVIDGVCRLRDGDYGTTFCTHIMINFPTESHDDFAASLTAADAFDEVVFLNYSDNQGTLAADIAPKVTNAEAKWRLDRASDYANHRKPGRSAVIDDFNCTTPYNMAAKREK